METKTIQEAANLIGFLSASEIRIQLFDDFQDGVTYDELKEDYKRSTVDKNLDDFKEMGLINLIDGEYTLSESGKLIEDEFITLVNNSPIVNDLQEILQLTADWQFDEIDIREFRDAKIHEPEPLVDGPPPRYETLVEQADVVYEIVPWFTSTSRIFHEAFLNNDLEAEFVHTYNLNEQVRSSDRYTNERKKHHESGQAKYFEYDGEFPFTLSIYDNDIVTLLIDSREGYTLIESDSEYVVEWAVSKFESYKEASTPADPL